MIISHKHRFIFIKTAKTAGSSLEIALSKYLGPRDVLTPLLVDDEAIRSDLGYVKPQNYFVPYRRYTKMDWARLGLMFKRREYPSHAPAHFVRQYIGEDVWGSYFKFAFERNPWDKVISAAWWRGNGSTDKKALSRYIESGAENGLAGFDLYSINGCIAVDRVFRFEDMQASLAELAERTGLPEVPTMPFAKRDHRKDRTHYRDVLSPKAAEVVRRAYAREIAHFGYEF